MRGNVILPSQSGHAAVEEDPSLREHPHSAAEELDHIRRILRLDADALWFIDYLAVPEPPDSEPPKDLLTAHRRLVEQGLQSAKTLYHESRKWTWLFTYHNRVVNELHAEGLIDDAERRELRIPAKSPLVFEFPPEAMPKG